MGRLLDIGPGTCETGLIKLLTIDYRSWLLHHVRAPGFQRPLSRRSVSDCDRAVPSV